MDHRQESLILSPQPKQIQPIHSLRDYQDQAANELWNGISSKAHQLCVLPTATGKTEIIKELVRRCVAIKRRCLVLVNRKTLAKQFIDRFIEFDPSVFSAGLNRKEKTGDLIIASIQSAFVHEFKFDLLFIDEAHNLSDSYYKFIDAHNSAKVIGFTATPYRDTGYIYGKDQFFSRIDFQRGMISMIEDGWIVPPTAKAPPHAFDLSNIKERNGDYIAKDLEELVADSEKVKEQVKDALPRLVARKKIVWACVSIKHAELIQSEIRRFEEAAILHSKQTVAAQELNKKAFEEGPYRHMISVMMVTEGYDYRPIDAIVLMRPTKSARLYVQIVGRGLRLYEDKKDCLVLDYGDVIKNLGPVTDPVIIRDKKKRDRSEPSLVKVCPSCFNTVLPIVKECDCGYAWPVPEPTKNLRQEAAMADIINLAPRVYEVRGEDIMFSKHTGKKSGNPCVKITYITGLLDGFHDYISAHPYSWSKHFPRLKTLLGDSTPTSFQEAYNMAEQLFCTHDNVEIEVIKDGGYSKIKTVRVKDRTPDSDLPF
jgi:DNA repair protein RadD